MKNSLKAIAPWTLGLLLAIAGAPCLRAQITNDIQANIGHSFVIGNKTLPPGQYTFHAESNTGGELMIARNGRGDNVDQFSVRPSIDQLTPRHSQLIFNKYGHTEFLSKIYEGGNRDGVAVSEISGREARLIRDGHHPVEHTEEQR